MISEREFIWITETEVHLHARPLIQGLDACKRVDPDPRNCIQFRQAVDSAAGSGEPVAILKTYLKDSVETLRLLGVAYMWRV